LSQLYSAPLFTESAGVRYGNVNGGGDGGAVAVVEFTRMTNARLHTHVRFASVWMPKTEAKERDCLSSCWEK
jgi:hypothetical protein